MLASLRSRSGEWQDIVTGAIHGVLHEGRRRFPSIEGEGVRQGDREEKVRKSTTPLTNTCWKDSGCGCCCKCPATSAVVLLSWTLGASGGAERLLSSRALPLAWCCRQECRHT